VKEQPWVVSVGDSFISGEAGRFAGNANQVKSVEKIDALGEKAYQPPTTPPEEAADVKIGEEGLPESCHRSKVALIHIGMGVGSTNLACSGAKTFSFEREGVPVMGLDFCGAEARSEEERKQREKEPCTKKPNAEAPYRGQALLLDEVAKRHKENGTPVKMVVASIGGNNFGFGRIVTQCLSDFVQGQISLEVEAAIRRIETAARKAAAEEIEILGERFGLPEWAKRAIEAAGVLATLELLKAGEATGLISPLQFCSREEAIKKLVEPAEPGKPLPQQEEIQKGLTRVGAAMERAGYNKEEYTLLVDQYPSVIPNGGGFRYAQTLQRQITGGCGVWNEDANWINGTVVPNIDNAVRAAAEAVGAKVLDLSGALVGHRLCETGVGLLDELEGPFKINAWNEPEEEAANKLEWVSQIRAVPAVVLKLEQKLGQLAAKAKELLGPVEREIEALEGRAKEVPLIGERAAAIIRALRIPVTGVSVAINALEGELKRIVGKVSAPFQSQESVHPNYFAQLAFRNCVRQAYNGGEPKGGKCVSAGPGLNPAVEPGSPREPKMKLE
jgi:hypothetical protein